MGACLCENIGPAEASGLCLLIQGGDVSGAPVLVGTREVLKRGFMKPFTQKQKFGFSHG